VAGCPAVVIGLRVLLRGHLGEKGIFNNSIAHQGRNRGDWIGIS